MVFNLSYQLVILTLNQGDFETILKKYDPRGDGKLTVDEWMKLASEEVFKKFLQILSLHAFREHFMQPKKIHQNKSNMELS